MARPIGRPRYQIGHNQYVGTGDLSKDVTALVVLGIVAWVASSATHGISWVLPVAFLIFAWVSEARLRKGLAAVWNMRVAAEETPEIAGAPAPAFSDLETFPPGLAVPLANGGVYFVPAVGPAHQFSPSEITDIDRELPDNRISIRTTSAVHPKILIFVQQWNVRAWKNIKDQRSSKKN
ncbi:hypothetical protein ACFV3E_36900 [Streptomyces sp. NPDC059718]